MPYEARLEAADAGSSACLAEVLTRESGSHQLRLRDGRQVADVARKWHVRELTPKHRLGSWGILAEQDGLESGPVKADLDTADSCEEPYHLGS